MLIQLIFLIELFRKKEDNIHAYMLGVIVWHVNIVIIVNLLSMFSHFETNWIRGTYCILDILLFIILVIHNKTPKIKEGIIHKLLESIKKNPFLLLLSAIVVFTLIYAVRMVPSNWDANTYHLTRIAQWAQNKSVSHFATANVRQLCSPVLAEYVNSIEYLLLGHNDLMVNLLQWSSYLTNAFFIFHITEKLSGGRWACNLASFLYLTMPIAFAESTTPQVDNYSAMWLLFFVYFVLELIIQDEHLTWNKENIGRIIALSLCVSFGYMSKPSIMVGILVFLIWMYRCLIKRDEDKKVLLKYTGLAVSVILIPNIPEWIRNIQTFGSISCSEVGAKQIVGTWKPQYIFINLLKNISWNMFIPGLSVFNEALKQLIYKLSILAHHVYINAPSISESGREFTYLTDQDYLFGSDSALNPILFYLAIISMIYLMFHRKHRNKIWVKYSQCAFISYILFCMILKWECFITRYLISYLLLLCPVVAIVIENCFSSRIVRKIAVISVIMVSSVSLYFSCITVIASSNITRPEGYFGLGNNYKNDYINICRYIADKQYTQIGLYFCQDSFEYPIWEMLSDDNVILHQVNVNNETAKYEDKKFVPDCILVSDQSRCKKSFIIYHGVKYQKNVGESKDRLMTYEIVR